MSRARNTIVVCSVLVGLAVISWTIVDLSRTDTTNYSDTGDPSPIPRPGPKIKEASRLPDEGPPAPAPRATERSSDSSADSPPQDEARQNPLRRTLQQKYGRAGANRDGGVKAAPDQHEQPEMPPASWTSLPEEYVTGILKEQLIPVAQSCYEDVAPKGTNGTLTLSVAVLGDAEIGGVIDHIDVNHTATSIEGELTDCVRHAAYDMEFAPPEEGQGVQEFDFSIEFSED